MPTDFVVDGQEYLDLKQRNAALLAAGNRMADVLDGLDAAWDVGVMELAEWRALAGGEGT